MKTTYATTEPARPVVKCVANVWHRAHKTGAERIVMVIADDKVELIVDDEQWNPLPHNLFHLCVKEFLRYAGVRVWPWTRSVGRRQCFVHAGDTRLAWFMESNDVKRELRIERSRE